MKRRDDPNQTLINWSDPTGAASTPASSIPDPIKLAAQAAAPLIQRLPWNFTTTFPRPTDDAIDAGVVDESDLEPANLKSLHDNYSRQCLATLQQHDKVMDARRRGIDPGTG